MKFFLHCAAVALILTTATACGSFSNRGVIERPMIGSASTRNMSFDKIELTDSSTVLHSVVHFRPGYWVRLAPTSEITVNDVSYPVLSVDGITLGEQVVIPDSAVVHFTMTFPAIPREAKSLDFSEGIEKGWAIWNVDLTGNATHDINRSQVPKAAFKKSRTMPEEMIAYGDSAVINLHLLGYKPEMGSRLSWVANTLHGQIGGDLTDANVDSLGNAVLKLALSTPADILPIQLDGGLSIGGSFFVAPGETLNAYLDTHRSGIWNMELRDDKEVFEYPAEYEGTFTDGIFPILKRKTDMELYSGNFGDYHMNGDEYTAYILDTYKALIDTVDAMPDLTDYSRRYNKAMLASELISAANSRVWLRRNYYHVHGWDSTIPADSINCVLSPENIRAIAEVIDLNDPWLLLSDNLNGNQVTAKFWEDAGVDPGVIKTIENYNLAYAAAENGELNSEVLADMNLPEPMTEEIKAHNAAMKARIQALAASSQERPVPDVAPDKVFDAIIAPHKGKVVVVDLWNTWCGPCRAAIKDNEPEKSGDLADDDIVWIYIANQTSPRVKYLQIISQIKGIHYQLDEPQWRAICDRFGVDGIPYYIIVDRSGNAEGRPDLRDHDLYKRTILEKLAR